MRGMCLWFKEGNVEGVRRSWVWCGWGECVLVGGDGPPPRMFGVCARASAVEVSGSRGKKWRGWACVGACMSVTVWLSMIVRRVEDAVELATVMGGVLLLGVVRSVCFCWVVVVLLV